MVEAGDRPAGDRYECGERGDPLSRRVLLPPPAAAELHAVVREPQQCEHGLSVQGVDGEPQIARTLQAEPVTCVPARRRRRREAVEDVRGFVEICELHPWHPRAQVIRRGGHEDRDGGMVHLVPQHPHDPAVR